MRGHARHRRSTILLLSLAGLAAGALSGCNSAGSRPSDVSGRYILTLCDADMPATALVDRQLGQRNPADQDMVTIIGLPIANNESDQYETPFAQISVSNSVLGPPQAVAVTPDGRWAYVIETQGQAPEGATTIDELPDGTRLTRLDLSVPTSPVEAGVLTVGANPMAVDVSPDGAWVSVATRQPRKQIQIIPISEGGMGEPLDFPLMGLDDDENTVPTCITWHPSGEFLAVTVPNIDTVSFYRVTRDAGSIGLVPWGQPVVVGNYPYSGKFSPDGRFYVTTDMQWDDVAGFHLRPEQGQLSVVRFQTDAGADPVHEVVAACPVGINPEGLAFSPDGSLVVTSNLVQSFLPDHQLGENPGGSLSLLTMNRATGVLSPVAEYPIDSMPIGLSFDAKGNYVVVTQFRSFDPDVVTGELAFFKVRKGSNPSLTKADFYVGVGKGPHGVLIVR